MTFLLLAGLLCTTQLLAQNNAYRPSARRCNPSRGGTTYPTGELKLCPRRHAANRLHPQSERLYQAIKGNGGTARLVLLPHEAHGYRARESVEHVLAEMFDWAGKYGGPVKP